jgi:hypothetical protein
VTAWSDHRELAIQNGSSFEFRRKSRTIQMAIQTTTMDICDYLKQGGQTAGHRELWRLLRTLFKDELNSDDRRAEAHYP